MTKPFLTATEQVDKLRTNGLRIPAEDQQLAEKFLLDNNYYRLSGYFRYYQQHPRAGLNTFDAGTEWTRVRDAYVYDGELTNFLREGLAAVEVVFRSQLAYLMAQSSGPTGYLGEPTYMDRGSSRSKLLKSIRDEVDRSDEAFVRHHTARGDDMPVWAAVEVLSFGTTSKMYSMIVDTEGVFKPLAARFGVSHRASVALFRAMVVLRNTCSHYSRIWNRADGVLVETPRAGQEPGDRAIYKNTPWAWCTTLVHLADTANGTIDYSERFWNLIDSLPDWFVEGLTHPSQK